MTRKRLSSEQFERLRGVRDRGHLRYVLLSGVIGWGFLTAVTFALVMSWWEEQERFLDVLPGALVTFGVGGVFFGEVMWRGICARCARREKSPPA